MILRSIKIVQDEDGNYAIRRRILLGYTYRDLTMDFWWGDDSHHINDCWSKNAERVYEKYRNLKNRPHWIIRGFQSFYNDIKKAITPKGKVITEDDLRLDTATQKLSGK